MRLACLIGIAVVAAAGATGQEPSPHAALAATLADAERLYDAASFTASARSFDDAICRASALGDEASLARAWSGLGRAQWAMGQNTTSLESDERALALVPRPGDRDFEALLLNNVGLGLYSTAHLAEALDYYALALGRAVSASMRALVLLNMGLVFRYQGRFEDSAAVLEEALAIRRAEGNARRTALTLNALGMLFRITGNYGRALECYEEALALRRSAQDRFGEAQTLNNLANVYGDQGEMEKSLAIHRQTLRLAEEIVYTRQIGLSHENIGAELDDLGRPREALAEACAAIALYRKTDDRSNVANALSNAGGYDVELGEPGEARFLLDEALDIALSIGEPEIQIVSLQGLAEADLAESKPTEALDRLDAALAMAEKLGFTGQEWKVRLDRARALGMLGRREQRLADLAAAAATINDLRARVGTDAGKIGFLDEAQEVFEELAEELSLSGRDAEALETAEAARARALADILSQRAVAGKPSDRAVLSAVRGAQARARGDPHGRGGDLGPAISRLREENPELASLVAVESPRLDEIRHIAARLDATIVEYLSGKSVCLAWVVTPSGELHAVRRPADRARLAAEVRETREALENGAASRPRRAALARDLSDLDTLLIEPLEPWLPRSPEGLVVIVPHGPLALVPYGALLDRAGRPLVVRHTLALSPAVSVYRYTASKGSGTLGRGPVRALVVADPKPPRGAGLPRLPGARREADLVSKRLGAGTLVLEGAEATESAVKQDLDGRDVLHFATHGLISEDRPLASSLLLGEGGGDDGYLRVDEIAGLDLHADLVVLSGCRTGLGRLSGDGILGLTRAFLYAGAASIVVSQWDVGDRSTAALMDRFYRGLAEGRGRAEALREAQLEALRRGRPARDWAAFVLVGEPR
jgi:CHAT domain-containing protein/tetratricopeptide (TPR) repeat protein